MSLSGCLEDLQLRDLLEILSLSHNDGLLQLRCGPELAELLFSEGLVVSAWRQGMVQADTLLGGQIGGIDGALLARARRLQMEVVPFRSLDRLLIEECGLTRESLSSILRPALISLVQELMHWGEGEFSFQSGPVEETLQQIASGEHLCLDSGLCIDELLCEKPIVLPVSNSVSEAPPLSVAHDVVAKSSSVYHQDEHVAVLLVDDDSQVAAQLVQALAQQGLNARSFNCGRDLLSSARSAWQAGQRPLLMIDLIMPRGHGGGILGGLELVEQIRLLQADQLCLVYSDYPCPEVEQRLKELGVNELLSKPRSQTPVSDAYSSAVDDFCNALAVKAGALLGGTATTVDIPSPEKPSSTMPSVESETESPVAVKSPGMGVLKGMLQELQAAESMDQVMLLVLRFASEVLGRAVLFSVSKDRMVGLGQFGYGNAEVSADEKVRQISLPLTEPSSFKEILERPVARCGPLGEGYWDTYLCQELGLSSCCEVFVGPLLSGDRVIAFLCGDNQNARHQIDDSHALEIFLQQAGIVLENMHMKDKLRNLSALMGKTFDC